MQRSPSRTGMPALVGLLLVVFAIAGLLVYEAWNTGRSRREIAERGLQDYAAYASWSTARAGENILTASLSTIFRGIAGNRVADGEPVTPINTLLAGARYLTQCDCAMDLPTDYYFRYDNRRSRNKIVRVTCARFENGKRMGGSQGRLVHGSGRCAFFD